MTSTRRIALMATLAAVILTGGDEPHKAEKRDSPIASVLTDLSEFQIPDPTPASPANPKGPSVVPAPSLASSAQTMAMFAAVSLAPAALLMITAFVRINLVLTLLRQALGSPQVPGNQVVMALALLLTALVMRPVAESVYERGIRPYSEHRLDAKSAWSAGSAPIKAFMIDQIYRTHHEKYLSELHAYSTDAPEPEAAEDLSLTVIAPAFLLSELTTAMFLGFAIYLPFLVIDLVVSAVLAAMGLFMLPPSLVALPLKLILFVLADGWMLVSGMLLRSFSG